MDAIPNTKGIIDIKILFVLLVILYDQMKQKIINNPDMLYKDYWKK